MKHAYNVKKNNKEKCLKLTLKTIYALKKI